jgi:hypothetical protein
LEYTIKSYTTDYEAIDLEIPDQVSDSNNIYKVVGVKDNAFVNCLGLKGNISIPDTITTVGVKVFSNARQLISVDSSITSIGKRAFACATHYGSSFTD